MKRIALCATDDAVASNLMGVIDLFDFANTVWRMLSPESESDLFEVKFFSPDGQAIKTSNGFNLPADGSAEQLLADDFDVLLVAGHYFRDGQQLSAYVERLQPFKQAFYHQHVQEKLLGSFCNGSFFLASIGLLDHRPATAPWWLAKFFQQHYPAVKVTLDELVVTSDHIMTAGATTSFQHLCLDLVRKLAGEVLASQLAKVLLLDPNRTSQRAFMSCDVQAIHLCKYAEADDDVIVQTQRWMQRHLNETISLDQLADRSAMSKRTFIRRFKQTLGDTPANYLQQLRVDEAKKLLETTHLSLEKIVPVVGYQDVSAFRKLFQRSTGLTPKMYRQKFNPNYRELMLA